MPPSPERRPKSGMNNCRCFDWHALSFLQRSVMNTRLPPLIVAVAIFLSAGLAEAQPDLRSVAGRPDLWPHDVVITAAVAAGPGSPALPAGTAVKVVGLEGQLINVEYQRLLLIVPVAQTDFLDRAAANAANRPLAPRPVPPPRPLEISAASPAPAKISPLTNLLGEKLAPDLLVFDRTTNVDRLIPGGAEAVSNGFLLLQFGGGRRWGGAMKDLAPAIQAARDRGANFGTLLVPLQGSSVQSLVALARESSFNGPMVDPRKTQTVADLWAKYGHEGTFALALVGPNGKIVNQTAPSGRSVDQFHDVTSALSMLPRK